MKRFFYFFIGFTPIFGVVFITIRVKKCGVAAPLAMLPALPAGRVRSVEV